MVRVIVFMESSSICQHNSLSLPSARKKTIISPPCNFNPTLIQKKCKLQKYYLIFPCIMYLYLNVLQNIWAVFEWWDSIRKKGRSGPINFKERYNLFYNKIKKQMKGLSLHRQKSYCVLLLALETLNVAVSTYKTLCQLYIT